MKSINFEFLRPDWDDLAALGGFAESYAATDPQSALVKLRLFAEQMVSAIYRRLNLPKTPQANLIDLLQGAAFRQATPKVVQDKLHALRIEGNKAAHGDRVGVTSADALIKEAHDLARWFSIAHLGRAASECPSYQSPPPGGAGAGLKAKLKQEKKAALEKLAAQEVQLQALLKDLESAREQAESAEQRVADLQAAASTGQQAADELRFDEAETRRRLIDAQLADAGWSVGPNGTDTEEVTREVRVEHQPTTSGIGFADDVLWDDNGKPLAVIESKRTSVDAENGRTQARHYADGLEKMHGQRPVIFYTNGFDIWIRDDANGYPPRKLFGFYSKDSLQYLVYQRHGRQALNTLSPKREIVDRGYQIEAIKRVTERLTNKQRKALVVQATGTGKTRVAIALADLLVRGGWVKRILFLCDRRELRKQAKNAFNDFLNEPLVTVGARTARDRQKRIYLATYPAMMKAFQSFDVGFFDLIIADESHRSIYNVYGDLFQWFDCLQVGLTATPVEFVARNTYRMFDCEDQAPTAYYSFERAVEERNLVSFEVHTYTTGFHRRGIKYDQLTDDQRRQLEEDGVDPEGLSYEVRDLDKNVYNKDTSRHVIRNLMENGIRTAEGQEIGKSIIFARNHEHAMVLRKVFDDLYPQYGGTYCQVIDNYDPRAEQLIDDFKDPLNPLTVAISVDMLDTGIDVPEVVNLVFAKPVYSKVKFWQMIGRGTRLCLDLFGPGKPKTGFRIFDHWGNFDYFDFHYQPVEPTQSKSLMQNLLEARIALAEGALQAAQPDAFTVVAQLIAEDINRLPEASIAVREKWRTKRQVANPETLHAWAPATVATLRAEIAPLMQWANIRDHTEAHALDLLIARMQLELLRKSGRLDDLRIDLLDKVNRLQMHLNPVREKAQRIQQVRSAGFWESISFADLEAVRKDLREIIHHRATGGGPPTPTAKILDIQEEASQIQTGRRSSSIPSVDMRAYERQVEAVLKDLFETDPVLRKIRHGKPVTDAELASLASLVLTQHPDVDLATLREFYGEAVPLDHILRTIVGMEPDAVRERFNDFLFEHPALTAKQTRFLGLLQNHIAKYGALAVERLYEDPFTMIDADGIDGVFPNEADADALVSVIQSFGPATQTEGESNAP